jgi:hypothetical protein
MVMLPSRRSSSDALRPLDDLALCSAPDSRTATATDLRPFQTETNNGIYMPAVSEFASAPSESNARTIVLWP